MKLVMNIALAVIFFVILDILFFGGREIQLISDRVLGADQNISGMLSAFIRDIRYAGCHQIGFGGPSCSFAPVGPIF